jgi:uncharacterized RDD family membrane protein YckC
VRCRGEWLAMVATIVALAIGVTSARAATDVLAAAAGRHVYVVRPGVETSGWEVVHLDAEGRGDRYRTVFRTPRRPEAIAAIGDRCFLVLAPFEEARPTPLALSFRVSQHPLNDVWFADPPGDPRVLPPLPTGGEIAGMVAVLSGELVVHQPSQRVARGVARTTAPTSADVESASSDSDPTIGEEGAMHLLSPPARFEWTEIETPPFFESAVDLAVGPMVKDGVAIPGLVWRSAAGPWRFAGLTGDGWGDGVVEGLPAGRPVSLVGLDGRTLLAFRDEANLLRVVDLVGSSSSEPGAAAITQARAFAVLESAAIGSRATMVATSGGLWIIDLEGTEVRIATVDRVDGRVSAVVVASEEDVGGSLVEYPIYAGVVMLVMMMSFLLRPHIERQPATLSDDLVPAGMLRRAAGLCIDLAPGLMASVLIFELEPAVFLEELRAGDPRAVAPAIVATVVATVITLVMEVATGRSLGKWVAGTRVVALDGSPGTRWQRGLRASLRLMLLLFWPIAVIALLDPAGRGMPELLSRTVVVAGRRPAESPGSVDPNG